MSDTIVALATPTGRSGIGVIRLSGGDALRTIGKLVNDADFVPVPRTAHLKQLHDPATTEVIDEAIITYFKAPHSFTGEDVIEIGCHGSPVVLRQVIDLCVGFGARIADPGEFTLRALSNGRMDLAEAEAIRDLIDAQTRASARLAIRQLRGEFSDQLKPVKRSLLDVIVVLESALEFVEDDLPESQSADIKSRLTEVADVIERLAATFTAGRLIREGLRVAIVGRPNVGKSSLFNALLGSERAIVTEIAGTTRDQLHERLTVEGIPISLIDTAGLRETDDVVESIGVRRSRAVMSDADVVVVMVDVSEELTAEDAEIFDSVADIEHLIVLNKIDKTDSHRIDTMIEKIGDRRSRLVRISAKTGTGLDELQRAFVEPFAALDSANSGFLITDARHHDLLTRAAADLRLSLNELDQKMSEEIPLVGLHNALRYLGQITGETTTEDMLTRIFETFCIGK